MIKGLLFLVSYSSGSSAISGVLDTWAKAGVFSYMIPFLLIFSLVFGILSKTKLFDNKSINAIISLAVALLALQFSAVPEFFSQIFPKVGIGLAFILAFAILFGLFMPKDKKNNGINILLFLVGFAIFAVVIISSFEGFSFQVNEFLQKNGVLLLTIGIVVGVIVIVTSLEKPRDKRKFNVATPLILPNDD